MRPADFPITFPAPGTKTSGLDLPVVWRRRCFAALVTVTSAALIALMAVTLSRNGISAAEALMLACFAVTLPWTVIGFWNALIGLVLMRLSRNPAAHVCPPLATLDQDAPITASTAVLVCIRNEAIDTVFRNVSAMAESLVRAGHGSRFHIYVLSDTDNPETAAAEEVAFAELERRCTDGIAVTYRRRRDNSGFKAGNIRDFCARWGERHAFALTLDADSFMTSEAILLLVRLMQSDPQLGIAQSLVTGLPSSSAFARIFQFGMRHGMRSYTLGSAWWQADCGPYWGHNAILRLEPFMAHCDLPELPGSGPLAGTILSHDQVEAVLMRRAGYHVRVVALDEGSWEENPASLPEFIRRDLRWCQGNMQYFPLLAMPGLKPISRMQLALAILMFLSAPAWITFVVTVSLLTVLAEDPSLLFWPEIGTVLFAVVITMVFAPKVASLVDTFADPARRQAYGGATRLAVSAAIETVFSMLIAPIMAVVQTVFLAGLPFGRQIGWPAQQRTVHTVPVGFACRRLWLPTLFGLSSLAWLFNASSYAALFALPVFLGPAVAVPIAVVTAWQPFGRTLGRLGLVPVPEENTRPPALAALQLEEIASSGQAGNLPAAPLEPASQLTNG